MQEKTSQKLRSPFLWLLTGLLTGSLLIACTDASKSKSTYPTIEGPVTEGSSSPFLATTTLDLASMGYEQAEYFISGNAASYVNDGALQSDGKWQVRAADIAGYKTRILVYRPIDPQRFNGTVVVEWLNVSGGIDSAADWVMGHTELMRSGYAWVGVSAQKEGVDGGGSFSLKTVDPARYDSLYHPGDSFSYDIFTQAAQAVRYPHGIDVLQGLVASRVIGAGESQSAFRLTTYMNAIARLNTLFNGFLIHSRLGGSAPLSEAPEAAVNAPTVVYVRSDLGLPVLVLQTESDLFILGSYADRQADTNLLRLWETAGTAHADTYSALTGFTDTGTDPNIANVLVTSSPVPGLITCDTPVNSGPQHFFVNAAFAALDNWIRTGTAPASAPLLQTAGTPPAFVLDGQGNVLGGVRSPYVDAPTATLSGEGQSGPGFCYLWGKTTLLDSGTLAGLYPDHATYVGLVSVSVDSDVAQGFLLAPDGDLIKAAAQASSIGGP